MIATSDSPAADFAAKPQCHANTRTTPTRHAVNDSMNPLRPATRTFEFCVRSLATDRRLSIPLTTGQILQIGRSPQNECSVGWDRAVSREHATAEFLADCLKVTCLPTASNSITCKGQSVREVTIRLGESFQIGQTLFELTCEGHTAKGGEVNGDAGAALEQLRRLDDLIEQVVETDRSDSETRPEPEAEEHSYDDAELNRFEFADAVRQMELLCDLPKHISSSQSDVELALTLVGLLLDAIPHAVAVAVAQYDPESVRQLKSDDGETVALPRPRLMRVQTREDYTGRFVPSRRLVAKALRSDTSTMHLWTPDRSTCGQFTMSDSLDWAFCVPIHGEACAGWCLYVSGNGNRDGGLLASEESLIGDLRFTQLVGQFIGSIRHVRHLQEQRTQLSSFFSPTIIGNLTSGTSAILLAPSERDISVLFCDVRGFSRKSEQQQGNLLHLLDCVKEALSAMTRGILKYDGAIADFQGDAALGFWGWPVSLDEGPIPACLAALAIAEEFRAPTCQGDFMEGFSVGIGIAHGRAVAGQIGTKQQAKIGVFGPVVNQGSRIEGLTRKFGVTICIDEVTADFVHKHLAPHQARVRRLARIRPKGMQTAITVSELLPPFSSTSHVTDSHIQQFETAVDLVISGDWEQARAALHNLPNDGPKSFLLDQMQKRDQVPPPDWDGAFWLSEK